MPGLDDAGGWILPGQGEQDLVVAATSGVAFNANFGPDRTLGIGTALDNLGEAPFPVGGETMLMVRLPGGGTVGTVPADAVVDPEQAIPMLTEALERSGDPGELLLRRGIIHHLLGRHGDAVLDLTLAAEELKSAPGRTSCLVYRARCWMNLGRLDATAADFSTAARGLRGRPAARLFSYAALIYASGPEGIRDPGRALELSAMAIEQAPDGPIEPVTIQAMAAAQTAMGRGREASRFLNEALASPTP